MNDEFFTLDLLQGVETEEEALNQLGRVFKSGDMDAARRLLRRKVNVRAARTISRRFTTKSQALLAEKQDRFNAVDQRLLKSGDLIMRDTVEYIAKEVTGLSGIIKMIDTTDEEVGILSFDDKGQVKDGENISVERIELGYFTDASVTDPKLAEWTEFLMSDEDAIANAELELWADNDLLVHIPMNALSVRKEDAIFFGYDLMRPILLESKQKIEIKLEVPTGSTIDATAKHHLKFFLVGSKTTKRA